MVLGVVAMVGAGVGQAQNASAIELILNGDFEAGTFASWTVTDLAGSSGSWFLDVPGSTIGGFSTLATPANGAFYAVTSQGGPGTHALEQTFIVPGVFSSVILTFDLFANDQSAGGLISNPAGLTHTAGPNQHARVDILSAGSSAFDTGAGVLFNVLAPFVDPNPDPNPFTSYAFDITGLVGGGGTFDLRFGQVDNQLFFNMGVDNVSISAVPEPSTILLLGSGLAGLVAWRIRKGRA